MISQIKREDIETEFCYEALTAAFEHKLGQFNANAAKALIQKKAPWATVEETIDQMAGPHGLMIFQKVDQGKITSLHGAAKRCALYIVGNPLIADRILSIDVRASLYVPFRVCIYEKSNPNAAIIGFDRPSSSLASLQQPALRDIGELLDRKIEGVVQAIIRN